MLQVVCRDYETISQPVAWDQAMNAPSGYGDLCR